MSNSNRFGVNGVELAWNEYGEGAPTLVLVHGFTGSSLDFELVVPALAEHRRVLTIDQRGHGDSTQLRALDGYTIEQLSEDLIPFLEAHGNGPVDLLGHSMGGRTVMGAVLARPDLVHSLILMDTSAWRFLPDIPAVEAMVGRVMDALDPAQGMPDPKTLDLGGPEADLIATMTPPQWQAAKDKSLAGMDPYAVKAFGQAILTSEDATGLRGRLGEITCPTTVLVGEHDHPMVDQADEHVSSLAHGRLALIPGAYHSPQLTHQAEWLVAIEAHLAG